MHLIRKVQANRYKASLERDTARIDPRLQLPVEILEQIVAYVTGKQILSTLCCVSRTLFAIAARIRWRRMTIETEISKPASYDMFIKAISSPRYSNLIVNLTILSDRRHLHCTRYFLQTGPCGCDLWEQGWANVACNLTSLESLQIRCKMCPYHVAKLDFIAELRTQSLRELYVECGCPTSDIDTGRILTAPCTRNLSALGWFVAPYYEWRTVQYQITNDIFSQDSISPDLATICLEEKSELASMLGSRPISRIGLWYYNDLARQSILQVAESLTHLNVEAEYPVVLEFVASIAPQLKRLRYLGRLSLNRSTVEGVLRGLETLRPLCRTLQALKLHFYYWIPLNSVQSILVALESTLPNLKAVLFEGNQRGVRLKADGWCLHREPEYYLSGWQTLNGDLERIILSQA